MDSLVLQWRGWLQGWRNLPIHINTLARFDRVPFYIPPEDAHMADRTA